MNTTKVQTLEHSVIETLKVYKKSVSEFRAAVNSDYENSELQEMCNFLLTASNEISQMLSETLEPEFLIEELIESLHQINEAIEYYRNYKPTYGHLNDPFPKPAPTEYALTDTETEELCFTPTEDFSAEHEFKEKYILLEEKLEAYEEEFTFQEQEISKLKEKETFYWSKLEDLKTRYSNLKSQKKQLVKDLENYQIHTQQLKNKLKNYKAKLSQLEQNYQKTISERDKLNFENIGLLNTCSQLEKQLGTFSEVSNQNFYIESLKWLQTILYSDDSVEIGIKKETSGPKAKVLMYIGNKTQSAIKNLRTSLHFVPFNLKLSINNEGPEEIQGCSKVLREIYAEALEVFEKEPLLRVSWTGNQLLLKLPVNTALFFTKGSKDSFESPYSALETFPSHKKVNLNLHQKFSVFKNGNQRTLLADSPFGSIIVKSEIQETMTVQVICENELLVKVLMSIFEEVISAY